MSIDFTVIGETAAKLMEMVERLYGDESDAQVLDVGIGVVVGYRKEGMDEQGSECCVRFSSPYRYVQNGLLEEMKLTINDGDGEDEEEENGGNE